MQNECFEFRAAKARSETTARFWGNTLLSEREEEEVEERI